MKLQLGDTVIVNKDKKGDLWKIEKFYRTNPRIVRLKGMTNRSIIDIYEDQIIKIDEGTIGKLSERNNRHCIGFLSDMREMLRNGDTAAEPNKNVESIKNDEEDKKNWIFNMPGTILHLDSYKPFMEKCIKLYRQLGIPAVGYYMDASEFPNKITELLEKERPDVLVITGHDSLRDNKKPFLMESYLNSKYFVEAVTEARKFDRNKNSLVIIAGACRSFFEAIMEAGANFASSPMRVRVSDVDPAIIAMIASLTPTLNSIDILKAINRTRAGTDGIGGIETEGTLRKAIPNKKYVPPADEEPPKNEAIDTPTNISRGHLDLYCPFNSCPYNFKSF